MISEFLTWSYRADPVLAARIALEADFNDNEAEAPAPALPCGARAVGGHA